jgi:hypothetical protein
VSLSWEWTEHAARQVEDRPTGWRDWLNWAVALCVAMAMWAAGAVAWIEIQPLWRGIWR